MKLKIILLPVVLCISFKIYTQTNCITIPLEFSGDSMYFKTADFGFGDSMISFTMFNGHATQGFAYPQARLEPITPLPPGMSLNSINDPTAVFASSWGPGEYAPVHIYYDVVEAIPDNYAVTFILWISNLSPLVDSCFFSDTIIMNLNPAGIVSAENLTIHEIEIYPNPVINNLNLALNNIDAIQYRYPF